MNKNEKNLPRGSLVSDLVPLFRASRWSEAVAASVLFDVLGDVLPRQLAAARAGVGALTAKASDVSDAEAEEAGL